MLKYVIPPPESEFLRITYLKIFGLFLGTTNTGCL